MKLAAATSLEILRRSDLWAAAELPFMPIGPGLSQLATYMDLLLKWNKSVNLSGCNEPLGLAKCLIQDSFFLAQVLQSLPVAANAQIYDLGAGAGLPGIPLRIFWQTGQYTWVERSQKRSLFLQNALARLNLPRVHGYSGDVREFLKSRSGTAQIIISRAFLPWRQMLDLCAPALRRTGSLVIMANTSPPTLPCPWLLQKSLVYQIPDVRQRWLWVLGLNPGQSK